MMADVDRLVKVISEELARQLIKEHGVNVSNTTIALRIGDSFSALNDLDVEDFFRFVKSYIEVAETHVSIPTFMVDEDGRVKTEDQLKSELHPLEF